MDTITNLQGHLLVASDVLSETIFAKSVIFVCEHSPESAMGVMINHPETEVNFNEILADLGVEHDIDNNPTVFNGGPVDQNVGIVLHTNEYFTRETFPISKEFSISANSHVLDDIVNGVGPDTMNFCLGYAQWGEGQLETEIKKNCWHVVPATVDIVFNKKAEDRYTEALKSMHLERFFGTVGLA